MGAMKVGGGSEEDGGGEADDEAGGEGEERTAGVGGDEAAGREGGKRKEKRQAEEGTEGGTAPPFTGGL